MVQIIVVFDFSHVPRTKCHIHAVPIAKMAALDLEWEIEEFPVELPYLGKSTMFYGQEWSQ